MWPFVQVFFVHFLKFVYIDYRQISVPIPKPLILLNFCFNLCSVLKIYVQLLNTIYHDRKNSDILGSHQQ